MIQNEPILRRSDMIRCALCSHAPCDAVCGRLAPSGLVRSIWFRNEQGAVLRLPEENLCLICDAPCEKACVRTGEVPIKDLINRLYCQVKPECETQLPDNEDRLKCDLCGIPLENPFLLSSLVVASTYDMCARAFEAGWAGACFKTICSLDIHEASPRFSAITGDGGSIVGFKNIEQLSDHSVAENMEIFRRLKAKYPTKFILASIMGQDALEFILLGGGSIQVTTAVMQYGYRIIDDLKEGLNLYLAEKRFSSVKEAVGLGLDSLSGTTDTLERDTVIFPRFDREHCIGCGRCEIACSDGGHQAIRLNAESKPVLDGRKCVGCHLCVLVCPQRAIAPGRKHVTQKTKR